MEPLKNLMDKAKLQFEDGEIDGVSRVEVTAKTMKAMGFQQPDIDKATKSEGLLVKYSSGSKVRYFVVG
tara:strand:+ start:280 stop:486 length:207 start_codon:yes stop_codon:yes gene_type:complete